MTNPYAAPSPSADTEGRAAGQLASKPLRVWIFQGLLMLQLAGAIAVSVSTLSSAEVRALPPSVILSGFIRPVVGVPVVAMLIVALQRRGPEPRLVAPVLAGFWWLLSITAYFALVPPPEPEVVRAVAFDDAAKPPRWVTGVVLHAGLLWFVRFDWRHHATWLYRSGATRTPE